MLQIHGNNKDGSRSSSSGIRLNVAHGTYTYPSDRKGIEQPHAEIMKQQGLDSTQHKASSQARMVRKARIARMATTTRQETTWPE